MRRRLAAALPVVAIVAVLVGLFLASGDAAERPPVVAGRAVVAIPTALAAPRPAPPPRRVAPDTGQAEVQLCGGAWVAVDAQGMPEEEALQTLLERSASETSRTVLAGLESSADPRDIATGLQLRMAMGRSSSADPETLDEAGRAAMGALVDIALLGRDPEVYQAARRACDRPVFDGSLPARPARCALLSAAQWAALDPGHAAPWLAQADEARAANDRAGEDEALWKASRAVRFETGFASPVARIFAHVPDDDAHALGAFGLTAAASSLSEVAIGAPAARSCRDAAVADPQRNAVCRALAEALVANGDTLLDRKIAIGIGRRAGWSEERLAALEAETNAWITAFPQPDTLDSTVDCKALRLGNERVRDLGRHGELGALRRALAARTPASAPVPLR